MHTGLEQQNDHEGVLNKLSVSNEYMNWDQINHDLTEISLEDNMSKVNLYQCLESVTLMALEVCARLVSLWKERERDGLFTGEDKESQNLSKF